MFCLVLDFELAVKNVIKELGVFTGGEFDGYSFQPPEIRNPQDKRFGAQKTWMELCGTVDVWITVSFPTFFLEMLFVNILQTEQKKASFLTV